MRTIWEMVAPNSPGWSMVVNQLASLPHMAFNALSGFASKAAQLKPLEWIIDGLFSWLNTWWEYLKGDFKNIKDIVTNRSSDLSKTLVK